MQVNVKYRSWSCQNSQKLQNNASSHYPTTIFALCIYFSQYETPLFRIHVFRTRRLTHTPSLSWLQNLNFKFGALRREKRRGLAFYTRTSCLKTSFFSPVCPFLPGELHTPRSTIDRSSSDTCWRWQQLSPAHWPTGSVPSTPLGQDQPSQGLGQIIPRKSFQWNEELNKSDNSA